MKILLITDQHFGVRNDNIAYINAYRKYYSEIVIPFIKASGIKDIINLGDTFDKRKSINFMSLDECKDMWFNPLEEMGVHMDMLIGNHDIYYKNTLRVNAPSELLGEYKNLTIHDTPSTINRDGLDILLLPWICDENKEESYQEIAESSAKVCMGHFELNGFEAHPGHMMTGGMDPSIFSKFEKVFTGHYHQKSTKKPITYLGNPCQLYWNDYGQKRGFHVFDTETLKTTFYRNPFDMFHKIYYNEKVSTDFDSLKGTYVKVIVEDKGDHVKFDHFIRELQHAEVADLKIVEDLGVELESGVEVVETEDTLSLLESYIDDTEIKANKENIKLILKSLYTEACSF